MNAPHPFERNRLIRFSHCDPAGIVFFPQLRLALGCRQGPEERVRVQQILVTTNLDSHRAIAIPDDLRDAMAKFQSR